MTALAIRSGREAVASKAMKAEEPNRLRALKLMKSEIGFIPNREFQAESSLVDDLVTDTLKPRGMQNHNDVGLPPHLRRMCESDLLTHEQERALFREMNLLKYRANMHRTRIRRAGYVLSTRPSHSQLSHAASGISPLQTKPFLLRCCDVTWHHTTSQAVEDAKA